MKARSAGLAAALLLLCDIEARADLITFSDGNFANQNWLGLQALVQLPIAAGEFSVFPTGGNPGSYIGVTFHGLPQLGSVTYAFTDAAFDITPANLGQLNGVTVAFDFNNLSGSANTSLGIYLHDGSKGPYTYPFLAAAPAVAGWNHYSFQLGSKDLDAIGSASNTNTLLSGPLVSATGMSASTLSHGLDNLSVTINYTPAVPAPPPSPTPEPSSFALLAIAVVGVAGLVCRRHGKPCRAAP